MTKTTVVDLDLCIDTIIKELDQESINKYLGVRLILKSELTSTNRFEVENDVLLSK